MGSRYVAGGDSPVSGVTHLFDGEQVDEATTLDGLTVEAQGSLCGAVRSYGPFRPRSEVPEGEVCSNCERVRERRVAAETE